MAYVNIGSFGVKPTPKARLFNVQFYTKCAVLCKFVHV